MVFVLVFAIAVVGTRWIVLAIVVVVGVLLLLLLLLLLLQLQLQALEAQHVPHDNTFHMTRESSNKNSDKNSNKNYITIAIETEL